MTQSFLLLVSWTYGSSFSSTFELYHHYYYYANIIIYIFLQRKSHLHANLSFLHLYVSYLDPKYCRPGLHPILFYLAGSTFSCRKTECLKYYALLEVFR